MDEFSDDLAPGSVVHRQHGVATYGGCGRSGPWAGPPQLPPAGVPGGRPAPAHRPDRSWAYTSGDSPTVSAGGSEWQRAPVQGPGQPSTDRRGLVALYRRQLQSPAALRAGHAVAGRAGVVLPLRRDGRPAPGHRGRGRRTWSGRTHGPRGCGLGQDRGGHPGPCSRPSRTVTRRGCPCRPHCWPAGAPDLRRPLRPFSLWGPSC